MKKLRTALPFLSCALFLGILISSCKKDDVGIQTMTKDFDAEVTLEWMDMVEVLSKETTGAFPPVVARAIAYIGLGLYEAVVPGMPEYRSMAGQVNGLNPGMIPDAGPGEYHWGAVANAVLSEMIKTCYSNATAANKLAMQELEEQYNTQFAAEVPADVYNRSIAHGKAVAAAVIEYADADGEANCFNTNFPTSYFAPVGVGLWKPTPPLFAPALQPYWGNVRPFLTVNVTDELPPPCPNYTMEPGSFFYEELMEVYHQVANNTDEQKTIAHFWSDDPGKSSTPPGHSLSILRQVLAMEQADLALSAEAFTLLGIAVHDAFVSCWKAKYMYNLIRPITVIHQEVEAGFTIPLPTPPFPEYTSGHSVQSGAAAKVLTELFGASYAFTDYTHINRVDINGAPRSFPSFYAFADEAAVSRLYGGIHYRIAIDEGVAQGLGVGSNIMAIPYKK